MFQISILISHVSSLETHPYPTLNPVFNLKFNDLHYGDFLCPKERRLPTCDCVNEVSTLRGIPGTHTTTTATGNSAEVCSQRIGLKGHKNKQIL